MKYIRKRGQNHEKSINELWDTFQRLTASFTIALKGGEDRKST